METEIKGNTSRFNTLPRRHWWQFWKPERLGMTAVEWDERMPVRLKEGDKVTIDWGNRVAECVVVKVLSDTSPDASRWSANGTPL